MALARMDGESALRYLRQRSLVSGTSQLKLRDISRRNHNLVVEIDGHPAWFIKQIQVHVPEVVASLEREARCCEHAHSGGAPAALRELMPRCASYDRDNSVLVMECLDGVNAADAQAAGEIDAASIAGAIGRALAQVHNASGAVLGGPLADVLPRNLPWVLRPSRTQWEGSRMSRWVALFESDPEVARELASLREDWQCTSFIHGDARPENFILRESAEPPRLKLVDWELADVGDPVWDCANVMQHYWTLWLKEDGARNAQWDVLCFVHRAFWKSYLAGREIGADNESQVLRRATQYTGARLVQTAYEQLASLGRCTSFVQRIALLARRLMTDPERALAVLKGSFVSAESEFARLWNANPTQSVEPEPSAELENEIYRTLFCGIQPRENPEPIASFAMALSCANLGTLPAQRKESVTDQPGTYIAYSRVPLNKDRLIRIYWNVTPRGAITLMAYFTPALNIRGIPFQLKVLLQTSVRRRDAAVLYFPASAWSAVAPLLKPAASAVKAAGAISPETPVFTKELFPGVAVAEDPPNGMSFGTHRSRLVARAFDAAHRAGEEGGRWSWVLAELEREGLSAEKPYLNPGSKDIYDC